MCAGAAPVRDWTLASGERQVADVVTDVRPDHVMRYEWAARLIPDGAVVGLDAFCGVGYGTQLLAARAAGFVIGVDGSSAAIAHAEAHFRSERTMFACKQWPFDLPKGAFDFVACFESLEHVGDGRAFLHALTRSLKPGGLLFLSTPNEAVMPAATFRNPFHVRHYTREEILSLAGDMELVEWLGQLADERGTTGELHPELARAEYLTFAFRRVR
jgi:2-polyprenyl-3-methyl-5-hydroxy-6-metoxy-1,4-benzoquinol methylase